ncbi:MAG: hypothetical protein ACREOO_12595 [bacterium]
MDQPDLGKQPGRTARRAGTHSHSQPAPKFLRTKAVVTVVGPGAAFEMEVTGAVSQFNGSLEILPYAVRRVGTKPPVTPRLTTTAAIAAQGESMEGALVKVSKAHILAGSFPGPGIGANLIIDDGSGPCTLRIDGETDIAGQPTPAEAIDLVGIVNQFDFSPPYSEGYQLLPRRRSDISIATHVESGDDSFAGPREFRLSQNHPNPFRSSAALSVFTFALPVDSNVRVEIFNVLGERVALLAEARFARGEHRIAWHGLEQQGRPVGSGIYFCRMQASANARVAMWSGVRKVVVLP